MDFVAAHSFLTDILHALSQALLAPDIILLLAFAGYALFCIGSIVVEALTERRNFRVEMPKFLAALMAADDAQIPQVVAQSGLLNRQKVALLTVYDYRTLPGDALVALIRRLVSEEETRYDRIASRNNMAAKIAPMLGLMGTLIPLGPGVAALGKANTEALSSSLLIAFDTTVAGLVVAAICLAIGKIRTNWYGDYMSALDSAMATMLQKIEDMRAAGAITVTEPTDYAFMYQKGLGKESAAPASKPQKADKAAPASKPQVARSEQPAGAQQARASRSVSAQSAERAASRHAQTSAAQPSRPVEDNAALRAARAAGRGVEVQPISQQADRSASYGYSDETRARRARHRADQDL